MEAHFLDLFLKISLGIVTYGLALALVQRRFGERGYFLLTAFLPLLLFITLDIGLLLASIFLTLSTYRQWTPNEPLSAIPLVQGWFANSALTISDWMVVVLHVTSFVLAHKMVYSGMVVRDRLRGGQEKSRDFAFEVAGFLTLALVYIVVMYGWESPVFVLRFAETLGVETADVKKVATLQQMTGSSWLLRAVYYGMPLLWLLPSVFSMYALTFFHSVVQQGNPTQTDNAPANAPSDSSVAPSGFPPQTVNGASTDTARLERDDAGRGAQNAERLTVEAEERAARAREAQSLAPEPVRKGATTPVSGATTGIVDANHAANNGHAANGHAASAETQAQIQEMLNQQEELRQRLHQAESEREALEFEHKRNPLFQPNRPSSNPPSEPSSADEIDDPRFASNPTPRSGENHV